MSDRVHRMIILTAVIGPFAALLFGIFLLWNKLVFASDLIMLVAFQTLFAMGVTVGYHRMLTHESFKVPSWLRYFFIICGAMAIEGSPLVWAATHIKHHAHSDEEDDPHSPLKSFWHAHMGWLFKQESFCNPKEYCPQLLEDKVLVRIHEMYWVWIALALGIPAAIGGWSGFLWGGVIRMFFTTHVTWSVNSICHTFGKRDFETTDESRNNWIIGLLAYGEGWHNNHHAFPKNAFHGMKWYQFDMSGLLIRGLERLGIAKEVQRVSNEIQEAHAVRGAKMHMTIAEMKMELGNRIDHAREELTAMIQKLPPERVAVLRLAHEQTMKRFADIQIGIERRRNMKKATLLRRQKEVAELFAIAKEKMRLMATA